MPNPKEKLLPDQFYHIYNRGINSCTVFRENKNRRFFLELYDTHISKIANTYGWVLLGNHFHLLVKIKSVDEIVARFPSGNADYADIPVEERIYQQFSNLFNSYARSFNNVYGRTGGLFETPFERIPVETDEYLKRLVLYIHLNPIHHRFCTSLIEYPWSSYMDCVSMSAEKKEYLFLHDLFGGRSKMIAEHKKFEENAILLNSFMKKVGD